MWLRTIAATLTVLLFAAPNVLASGRNPGSVGIFPIHRSGPSLATIISLTNTAKLDETLVHFEYVNVVANQANQFKPLSCTVFDRIELLTPADTFTTLTRCHNATIGSGQEGYLVVSAQDPSGFDVPWSFNHLIGSELVINVSGVSYGLNMISIVSPQLEGTATDVVGDGDGRLDFDTVEYDAMPDKLYVDSFLALFESQLMLGSLTGGPNSINTVLFSVWNDNEYPLSTTLQFKCWFDAELDQISPLFTESFLGNNTPDDPAELDIDCNGVADAEGGWAIIESIDVSQPSGIYIDSDGVLFGAITVGPGVGIDGGHNFWESTELQTNGSFLEP